jgi:hypothetical protein
MVATKVEKVRRRHLDRLLDQRLATEGCLRGSDGRFQKRAIPQAAQATVRREHLFVDGKHGLHVEVPKRALRQGA